MFVCLFVYSRFSFFISFTHLLFVVRL
jgi:hypothetical protein